MDAAPEFSIVTPSFNMLGYLRRCRRSIADQDGVTPEHLVIDGGSTDGSAAWLEEQEGIVGIREKDEGMYDALNKGFRRARGGILAWLNCDEQYLPGTLRAVREFFADHPEVDLVFGDALLIRPDGSLIAFRKAYRPRWYTILATHLYALSCTMFVRASAVQERDLFDSSLRNIGDQDFVVRMLRRGHRAGHLRRYLAAFTMTGANMSASEDARRESQRALRLAPAWVRLLRGPLHLLHWSEKWLAGCYRQALPLTYAVYDSPDAAARRTFQAGHASFRWRTR